MFIPETKDQQLALNNLINECVQFNREIETLKEDTKNNAEIANETIGISKKDFNSLLKVAIDEAKIQDQIETLQDSISSYNKLKQ